MSYMDNGEDEVDYGEEEIGDRGAGLPAGDVSAFAEDPRAAAAAADEEDYDDLYDDVNIAHFEPAPDISKKKTPDSGLGMGYDEDDEAFPDADGLPAAPVFGNSLKTAAYPPVKQEPVGGSQQVAGIQDKREVPGILPVIKDQVALDADIKPSVASLAVNPPYQEGINMPGQAKGTSLVSLSTRPKSEKDQESAAWPSERPDLAMQVKDEVDSTSKGLTQKALTNTMYVPQGRGSGALTTEPAAGAGHTGKEADYGAADDIRPTIMVAGNDARGRGAGRGGDAERASAGVGRPVQGAGNRDSGMANDYTGRHGGSSQSGDGGGTMLFVGELEWWTTDAELEAALSEFGSVKNLKFFEERASGKSKGYCQVEFYDHSAAVACKEGMNGRKFHGRSCLVAFANTRTIIQLGNAQVNKAQAQIQAQQAQLQSRRTMNDSGTNTRGASSYQGGDNTRSYGRMTGSGRGGHGQGTGGRGPGRGRSNMGNKGNGGSGGGASYGQGLVGPMGSHPSGMMMPQAMLGQGYDAGYGPPRGGAGYGGYVLPGPPFTGMMPPFPTMGPGTLAGVAPHVNPAFFSRNATTAGMGMMAGNGLDVSSAGMWGDGGLNGWGAEEERRAREVGYGDDMGGSDYGYNNEMVYEKSRGGGGRDKDWDRASEGDLSERWRRDDRESEKERHRDRDGYRDQRDRDRDLDDDWEREKSIRTRNKMRMVDEEDKEDVRVRPREEDYGKRRRLGSER